MTTVDELLSLRGDARATDEVTRADFPDLLPASLQLPRIGSRSDNSPQ